MLGVLWRLIRFPLLLLMVTLEPVVAISCAALALLGVLTTLLFAALRVPHFPTLTMLALSLGFAASLFLYERLIRLLAD